MRQDKRIKDNQPELIFDYNNFINKSSQLRYFELRSEVKNKLNNISSDINIAGSNAEEKKYNLLMHYKHLSENFKFGKEKEAYDFQVLLTLAVAIATIISAWFTIIMDFFNKIFGDWLVSYLTSALVLIVIVIAVEALFGANKNRRKRSIENESQRYSYYNFYYNELKKYIKEDE